MAPRFPHVFFDLDGTLTDSAPGILNSCQYALRRLGLDIPRSELYWVIGPPLLESFTKIAGSAERGRECVRLYREYFSRRGMYENSVYPGVRELLGALMDAGCRNVLATAKPLVYAARIAEHFGLSRFFHLMGGADLDGPLRSKRDVLADNLRRLGADPSRTLMVGDRLDDVEGARALGLACAAVSYGYAEEGELEGADWICARPADLLPLALEGRPLR